MDSYGREHFVCPWCGLSGWFYQANIEQHQKFHQDNGDNADGGQAVGQGGGQGGGGQEVNKPSFVAQLSFR
ncbi:hypothetical protein ACP4OV_007385 [Aristida adscensionis]